MRARSVMYVLLAAATLIAVPAMGQGNGKGKEKKHEKENERSDDDDKNGKHKEKFERARNRDEDERVVNRYFGNTESLPHGLAKRQALPPGLARQLQVNGTLPPGLAKKMRPVPVTLTRQLVPLPNTQRRVVIGNQLVVLDAAQRIVDLFTLP